MFRKQIFAAIVMIAMTVPALLACSLPAEPCAAIVPINAAESGMKLVQEGNTFFYVVPQGASAQF
ncbi:MAG TPA: hypothetical protein PLR50_11750, partial [Candidatus Rifleibacterium sp.]|nr:hypothetical protein [Candidatus Rifleibacterium sp.]